MHIKLIINPAAGRRKIDRYRNRIVEILSRNNELDISETIKSMDFSYLSGQINDKKYDMVVVAGGDGTVNAVINAMFSAGIFLPVGIIPLGAGNIFTLSLGITRDPIKATQAILQKQTRKVDLGKIKNKSGSRYFLGMAGIGYDAHGARLVNQKSRWGSILGNFLTYIIIGVNEVINYSGSKLSIQIDNRSYEGYNLIISNVKLHAGGVTIARDAEIDDGYLDVNLFKKGTKVSVARYILGIIGGIHSRYKDVMSFKCKKIKITARSETLIQTDGEAFNLLFPAEIEVQPKALELIVPKI